MVASIPSASPDDTNPASARDELRNVICAQAINPEGAEGMLEAFRAEVLAEAAELVRADVAHIRYGSATEYAECHAALLLNATSPDGPLCTCDHGQRRHYVDTTYGAPGPIRGCYDCPTGSHLHQFVPAGGAR